MSIINNPHDTFFKAMMTDPRKARAFMEQYFTPDRLAMCDLSTLKEEKDSFLDADLRGYCSDILWSMRTTSGGSGYVYALIEHQSTPDPMMAFRMLHYAVAVMYRDFQSGESKKLPLVFPVLFYTGKRNPYPYSMRWYDTFDNPEMAQKVYNNPFQLIDVSTIPDEAIPAHQRLAVMELLFKKVATGQNLTGTEFGQLMARCRLKGYTDDNDIISAVTYALNAAPISDHPDFVDQVMQQLPQAEEKIMSVATTFKEKCLQEGMKKGIEQGIEKGRLESRQQTARNLMRMGLADEFILQATQLSPRELKSLRS